MIIVKINKFKDFIKNIFWPFVGLGIFFIIWYIIARIINLELILPSPAESFKRLFILFEKSFFWQAVLSTLTRSIISFCISLVLGTILSILSYIFKPIKKIIAPIVVLLRSVPTMSIILISLIWFKNAVAPIVISTIITFPILYSGFMSSLDEIDRKVVEMSDFYHVPFIQKLLKLFLPYVAPSSLNAIQSGLSFNIKLIIAAEVLASTTQSMGRYMQVSKVYLDTAELLGWTIMAILISYLLESIILLIKKIVIRWK